MTKLRAFQGDAQRIAEIDGALNSLGLEKYGAMQAELAAVASGIKIILETIRTTGATDKDAALEFVLVIAENMSKKIKINSNGLVFISEETMNGLPAAQRHYDRQEPLYPVEDETEERDVSHLAPAEVDALTERFIAAFAAAANNFIEDMGGAPGDLDCVAKTAAQLWTHGRDRIDPDIGCALWHSMRDRALSAWVNGWFNF